MKGNSKITGFQTVYIFIRRVIDKISNTIIRALGRSLPGFIRNLFLSIASNPSILSSLCIADAASLMRIRLTLKKKSDKVAFEYFDYLWSRRCVPILENEIKYFENDFPFVTRFFEIRLQGFSKKEEVSEDWEKLYLELKVSGQFSTNPVFLTIMGASQHLAVLSWIRAGKILEALETIEDPFYVALTPFLAEIDALVIVLRKKIWACTDSAAHAELVKFSIRVSRILFTRIANSPFWMHSFYRFKACAAQAFLSSVEQGKSSSMSHGMLIKRFRLLSVIRPFMPYLDRLRRLEVSPSIDQNAFFDIRINRNQHDQFENLILSKIAEKNPFSLIRLGDGESYAFPELVPSEIAEVFQRDIETRENTWWGTSLDESIREQIQIDVKKSVLSADILGIPGIYRLSRDLTSDGNLNFNTRGHLVVQRFLIENILVDRDAVKPILVDERCNLEIFTNIFLNKMIMESGEVLIIGGFLEEKIRLIDWPCPLRYLRIPPHQRTVLHSEEYKGLRSLPEIRNSILERLASEVTPGLLVLVAAGIAGKIFCAEAKRLGGVAIDIGSALDRVLGYN